MRRALRVILCRKGNHGVSRMTTLLVGTTKGLFTLHSGDRDVWDVAGPHCDGWPINHATGTSDGRIWAAGGGTDTGAGIWRTGDGEDWTLSKLSNGTWDAWLRDHPAEAEAFGMAPAPDAPYTGRIDSIWSIARVGTTLYAGARPATLFVSHDDGATWDEVTGLTDHPSRGEWEPGGAGLTLHTIVTDPGRPKTMWLGISAAGVFATEDGGETWERRNRLSNESTRADVHHHDGEIGHCVHNIVRAGGDRLYQQNHHGVFRSLDGGRSWDAISDGLPSTFGFPVAVDPGDPDRLWVLPLNGDTKGRFPPDAAAAVWHSADGGATWTAEREGLPQAGCYFTVLRQAMATDRRAPSGVYFGTNSGSVFARTGDGPEWREIARHLPTVLCVEVAEDA